MDDYNRSKDRNKDYMKAASPHKMHKPRPMRPKYQSPGKYSNGYSNYGNQYTAAVPYQYATPPAIHKFNHYRYTTWGDYGGYYSQFGYSQRQENGGGDNGEMREVADKFNRNRKMSREVLFMEQQIYQDDPWGKDGGVGDDGELEEELMLKDDVDVFSREECHSAPPLPFSHSIQSPPERNRHNSMSPHQRHSPNFRRTPGASRPNSRQSHYSGGTGGGGSRPGSSLSMRSNSPYGGGSYNSAYNNDSSQFYPVRRTSPMLSISDLGEDGRSEGGEVDSEHPHVELMVSNLDYNISAREWKKILYAEFHQHVQVIDVYIQTQPDNTNIGFIKVPAVDDARFAISQFHRKKIGYKRIHVTLVNQDEASAANTKSDVVTILQEVPSHQLSLYKLMELYEKRFKHPVTVTEIYGFQDVLEIWELEGQGKVVRMLPTATDQQNGGLGDEETSRDFPTSPLCSIHCPEGSSAFQEAMESSVVVFVTLQLKSFSAQVHTLIQSHEDCLPLASFPTCYGCEFGPLQTVSHGGIPLEHVISCVPGVKIAVTPSGVKNIQWAENKPPPSIEHGRYCPSPLLNQQLLQFSREVVELLKHSPQCRLPFNKFIPTYHHTLGRQCRVADYGYTKLMELFDAIPHVVQVIGVGNRKYVTLTHRAQMKRFSMDILRVLKSQASKQISVHDLPVVYNKVFGKPFELTEFGLSYLEDILGELPDNTISVSGTGADMILSIPRRDQTTDEVEMTKQFALEVIDLLKHSPQCRMPFHRFIPAYHHHFGKQCRVSDYGFTKLVELFEAIPHVLKIVDEQEDKLLTLVESELLKVLEEQVAALLKSCPDHKLPVPEFLSSYTKFHGHSLRLQDYGVTSVMELMEKIQRIAQVESREGKYIIKLVDQSHVRMLAHRILLLLMEQIDGAMDLEVIQERYKQLFGYTFSEAEVTQDLDALVQMTMTAGKKYIKLCPLQMFARDVRSLLRHHNGKLALGQFESAYANHFGVHLVAASYGYPSFTALLQAIPHVAQIRGKGQHRTVLLCQDFQGKLITRPVATSPLLSDGDNSEHNGDLMAHDSAPARISPCDLLATTVPSCVPSPELVPASHMAQSDLMRFDHGSINVQDFFESLSPTEKKGQKTPLCKTPVSEMLQFAAQLLPNDNNPSSSEDQHLPYYHHNSWYSQANSVYMPAVPTDAPHVAMLEQQMNNHSRSDILSDYNSNNQSYPFSTASSEYSRPTVFGNGVIESSAEPWDRSFQGATNGSVHNADDRRLLSMLQGGHKHSDRPKAFLNPPPNVPSSGLENSHSNHKLDIDEDALTNEARNDISDPGRIGGTLFWMKTEALGNSLGSSASTDVTNSSLRVSPAGCEASSHSGVSTQSRPFSANSQNGMPSSFIPPTSLLEASKRATTAEALENAMTKPVVSPDTVVKTEGSLGTSHSSNEPTYQLLTPEALGMPARPMTPTGLVLPGKLPYSAVVAQGTAVKQPTSLKTSSALEATAAKLEDNTPAETPIKPTSDEVVVEVKTLSPSTSPQKDSVSICDYTKKEPIESEVSSPTRAAVMTNHVAPQRRVSGSSSLADEDVTDTSTTSTPSPSRKLGTPRKSRLAAKFNSSPIEQ